MPLLDVLRVSVPLAAASGTEGPTSAAVGLPIILLLVAVVVVGGIVYAVVRKR